MHRAARFVTAAIACVALSGCGELLQATHFKEGAPVEETSFSVDAKQRFIVSLERTDGRPAPTGRIVCAEPSPDALSALAASLGAGVAGGAGQPAGSLSTGLSESAASIAIRTATIQLLRDGFYRACEAYMNGAVDEFGYGLLLTAANDSMVQLLAVEGLTGVARAGQAGVSAVAAPQTVTVTSAPAETADGEGATASAGGETAGTASVTFGAAAGGGAAGTVDNEAVARVVNAIVDKASRDNNMIGACAIAYAKRSRDGNRDYLDDTFNELRALCDQMLKLEAARLDAANRQLARQLSESDERQLGRTQCREWLMTTPPDQRDPETSQFCFTNLGIRSASLNN